MMSGSGSTQQSLRKALGTLKDSTKVGLAKVNSEYKDVDIAIVKATNHEEKISKEKHIRTIFSAVSASRSQADIQYCISSLARRLGKTHNWAVALKILIAIHRALREADPAFRGELIGYISNRGHVLNLSHFRDDSSPNAWEYSAWIRTYALYLEERLECFRVITYDVETEECNRMGELKTGDLLEHLAAFQQLLFRLLECQPDGAAKFNSVIQYAFSIVGSECVKLYAAIDSATILMVNRFFDMQPHDAVRALEIYRKAGQQAGRLSDFYEFCNGLNLWKSEKIIRVKQPPESFVAAMEEYVKEAPRSMPSPFNEGGDREESFPRHELKKVNDNKARPVSVPDLETVDLLGLDDIDWGAAEFDGRNFSSLYFSAAGNPPNRSTVIQEPATGDEDWKLELVPMERKMSPDSGDSSETTEMTTSPCESSVFKEMESSHAVEGSLTAVDELAGDKLTVAAAATAAVVDLSNPFGDPIGSITQRNGSF